MSPVSADSDLQLVHGCVSGDADAWATLVDRYAALIYSVPRKLGLSQADSEDIVQTVFAILMNRIESIDDIAALPKWIITTTRRECWRHLRRTARRDEVEQEASPDSVRAADAASMDGLDRHVAVRTALAGMGPRCRDLLTILFLHGERPDYGAISAALDIPVGSIGPTRARCLRKLGAHLQTSPGAADLFPELADVEPDP